MANLTPLGADQFPEFLDLAVASYAADNVASGRWLAADAAQLARRESEQLLSAGVATPGHYLYAITAAESPQPVGYLWFATLDRGSTKVAYVYQIMVKPAFRRRGFARDALREAELLAGSSGHSSIALNVFAQNAGARALYESLGYRVTNMNMAKPIVANAP